MYIKKNVYKNIYKKKEIEKFVYIGNIHRRKMYIEKFVYCFFLCAGFCAYIKKKKCEEKCL